MTLRHVHERIQKIASGGPLSSHQHVVLGVPYGLLREAIRPLGRSVPVFLRKHIGTCDFPGGRDLLLPQSGSIHAVLRQLFCRCQFLTGQRHQALPQSCKKGNTLYSDGYSITYMGLPIGYFNGSQVDFSKLLCISVPEGCFDLSKQCRP